MTTLSSDPLRPPVREQTSPRGLSPDEVARRVADGRTNAVTLRTSRSVGEIVRANTFTVFNAVLVGLFAVVLLTGRWQNGLFVIVVVVNAGIGIVQEVRAKRTLDRLAVLNAPRARVVRDGTPVDIDVAGVVEDDLVEVGVGDQIVADGFVSSADGLEIDEALLTGESEPVAKHAGDAVRSGSIVVGGAGRFQATAVGENTYATTLAIEARRFALTFSEIVSDTNRILRWIAAGIAIVGPVVLWSQFRTTENSGWRDAATGTVAALVGMVPEGLVLLTSLAFMVATLALARKQTLVQELPAVEALARVDVVCLDKTGTLTHGDLVLQEVRICTAAEPTDVHDALALFGGPSSSVSRELDRRFPLDDEMQVVDSVPFSSARKWAAAQLPSGTTFVFGAPEFLVPLADHPVRLDADALAASGRRVVMLATTTESVTADSDLPRLQPIALTLFGEHVREDAAATLDFFTRQGVQLKILSGDNPRTVGAVAAKLGVAGIVDADDAIDARTLPDDPHELAGVLEQHSVFGRVSPAQKRAIVGALQQRGHVVAMTGDGVNDALALKDADIGVAMASGAAATRAVAQLVLLDNRFAHLPEVVAEGRRVIANIERAANLFLVKNVYSLTLALICAATLSAYPLAPIQLTLISSLTIGIPGFFLALGPNTRRYVPGFLRRILRFSVPAGAVIGMSAFAAYRVTRTLEPSAGVAAARTTATLFVLATALCVLLVLARPLAGWKLALVAAMALGAAVVCVIPPLGHGVFLLDVTPARVGLAALFAAGASAAVVAVHRFAGSDLGPAADPTFAADRSGSPGRE